MKDLVVWFKDVGKDDVSLVGGKGANLGEMTQAGFPVPPGFIITTTAYREFLRENNLEIKIKHLLGLVEYDTEESLEKISKQIEHLIKEGLLPKELVGQIFTAYATLSGPLSQALVAVRSSATAEDSPGASFAGQQETYLNVKGEANLLIRLKDCWASMFHPRALFYRHEQKIDGLKAAIAVPVQKMIESEASGILFSLDPVTNNKEKVVVEAVFGLGEMIVQGELTPDHYEVDKKSLTITNKKITQQKTMLIKKGTENREVEVTKDAQNKQKITDHQIIELAELSKKLEKHYYFPQDGEWAVEKGKVYLVQTRPITTVAAVAKVGQQKVNTASSSLKLLLKGDPASPGIATGPVRILKNAKEIDNLKMGDVLVAEQTNPDFVPAMKKACAIVTDKGGRTCFAGSTMVLTQLGFLSMEELYNRQKAGEEFTILAYDYKNKTSAWKKVLSSQKNRLDTIQIAISQTGRMTANTLDVTADHKFYTYKQRKLIKKPLKDILSADEAACLLDYLPQSSNQFEVSNKLAYLLGALGTDGNVYLTKGKNVQWRRGSVTFTQKQCEYKQDFINTVQSHFLDLYSYQLHSRDKIATSYLRGRLVSGVATDYRCFSLPIALEIKKLLKDLPLLAASFSEETACYFLAGILDGDGSFSNNRIQIYASKKYVYESIIISCLRLGIMPQVTINRTIYNIQILERMSDILAYSQKIKVQPHKKVLGNKLFAAKQIFSDVTDIVNYKGRIKPYIKSNLLLDARKIQEYILPMVKGELSDEIDTLLHASLRMQRVAKVKNLGVTDVYNIEVAATNELDHNFVVFSKRYTPILVSNSHAAIVSREIGIPAVVGTEKGTRDLKNGDIITVNGQTGEVFQGGTVGFVKTPVVASPFIPTATKVYVNLAEPEFASTIAQRHVDGVGLLRAEFMMAGIGTHPKKMIDEGKSKEFVEKLATGIAQFAKSFSPRPVVYRASDFKTNEYRELVGGRKYEPVEPNPMLGYRGVFRYIHDPEVFHLELEAIKHVRNKMGLKNLHLMLPFVRTPKELEEVKKLIASSGLYRSPSFKIWMMVEVPSNVILLEKFIEQGIDGVSIGSNDLTMLLLGTDRDNSEVAREFNEQDDAVLWAIEHVIRTAHKYKITSSLCGQAASTYPQLLKKIVDLGITSVSVSPDAIESTREHIAAIEKDLINHT